MRHKALLLCSAVVFFSAALSGQVWNKNTSSRPPFFDTPPRVLGQVPDPSNPALPRSFAPNMVEGREFWAPLSVALDTSVSPPALYVADSRNNRVLGWRNAQASGAASADVVLGQPDKFSTGPNSGRSGLAAPSSVAVDARGNVYVLDSGNNRILRFPRPFEDTNDPKRADAVIGQPDFSTSTVNNGGVSAQSLDAIATTEVGGVGGALLFDPDGNLWVTDTGNHRVLMYRKDHLDSAASVRVQASMVIGQVDFTSNTSTNTFNSASKFNAPVALAMDDGRRLFVADSMHRVLAFEPPFASGMAAKKMIGTIQTNGRPFSPPNDKSLLAPQGLATNGSELIVADTYNNRLLRFPPYTAWTDPAAATSVVGQSNFASNSAGGGISGLTLPTQMAVAANELYVADLGNNRIVVFPLSSGGTTRVLGQFNAEYSSANLAEGKEFFLRNDAGFPSKVGGGMALDSRNGLARLYVSDTFNNRVLGFCDARKMKAGDIADVVIGQPDRFQTRANWTPSGQSARTDSNLAFPVGLAVDSGGNLFVADLGNSRVLRFPEPCANPRAAQRANLVLGQSDFFTRDTTPSSSSMLEPYGIAILPQEQHVLVSDRQFNRVLMFKKPVGGDFRSGQAAEAVFGQSNFTDTAAGTSPDRMQDPRHISTDSSGRLYVGDTGNRRVQVFSAVAGATSGPTPSITVNTGLGTAGLSKPHLVWVDPATGEMWVGELETNQLLRYPEYERLSLLGERANLELRLLGTGNAPVGVAVDSSSGVLFVAELGNRVAMYVPPTHATDGGNFVYGRELTPGMIATLWPEFPRLGNPPVAPYQGQPYRGTGTVGFDWFSPALIPLPTTLMDTQVLMNGQPVPLYYVSAGQINFQVPKGAPESGIVDVQVVRASTGEVLAAGMARMKHAQPAFLMHNDAPFSPGQVAALNAGDDPRSCNGPDGPAIPGFCPGGTRPARRGEVIELFLIGSGRIDGDTAKDGEPASGAADVLRNKVRVLIGIDFVPDGNIQYSGPAPGLLNVWQINVKIPDNAPPGPTAIAVSYRDVPSSVSGNPRTFISIR